MYFTKPTILLGALLVLASIDRVHADDWSQWRGANRVGVCLGDGRARIGRDRQNVLAQGFNAFVWQWQREFAAVVTEVDGHGKYLFGWT